MTNDTFHNRSIPKIHKELIHATYTKKNQAIQLKSGLMTWIDISLERECEEARHQQSSGECKLKPQWDAHSHLPEGLPSINQQTSAGEDVENGEVWRTAGGAGNWCIRHGERAGGSSKN